MTSPFLWRGTPSQIAQSLQPSPKARTKVDLAPKRLYVYSQAMASKLDEQRESLIAQTNREVERHFALAQSVADSDLRRQHREEARRLAANARALVLGRSADFVAKLEQARGLA